MGASPRLALFAKAVVAVAFLVVFRGALVTSWNAGMAVPDWPLSFGSLNPPGWWRNFGVWLEHGHRLIAGAATLLTIVLCGWVWYEPRARHVRAMAALALAGVFVQALAGGLRVIIRTGGDEQTATVFRIVHGCLAHAEVCLLVVVATLLSSRWQGWPRIPSLPQKLAWLTFGAVYLQIVAGAIIRHLGWGLAIATFPAASPTGGFMPAQHGPPIDSNFTHTRMGALVVTLLVLVLAWRTIAAAGGEGRLARPAWGLLGLVVLQVAMGICVIWYVRPITLTTLHVVNGTLLLATTLLLALRLQRAQAVGMG